MRFYRLREFSATSTVWTVLAPPTYSVYSWMIYLQRGFGTLAATASLALITCGCQN